MKELFVVIDMQNDFLTGALKNDDAVSIIGNIRKALDDAIARGATVAFTRDTHTPDYLRTREGRLLPVPHCIVGTDGHKITAELSSYAQNVVIFDKPTFGSVELAEYAAKAKFDTVTLVGVCTDICVISNAFTLKSVLPEAEITVLADCCAGVTKDSHNTALSAMRAAQINIA